jgi:ATP-dependent RNA helicase RhlE
MLFKDFGLSDKIVQALHEKGYKEPTAIQKQTLPIILLGKDLLASSQTGTGKTAGFTLPLLQNLLSSGKKKPFTPVRALILAPTRELAMQIETSLKIYGKYLPLTSMVLFGGVGIHPQIQMLKKGVDIVVATPGRLLDLVRQKALSLSQVEILVLDEADRMLDMGFIHDIRKILALLPAQRQNLLFSATFSSEIQQLGKSLLHQPKIVRNAPETPAADKVSQVVHPVDVKQKKELLLHLIQSQCWEQVLVFTRTKHGANKVALFLQKKGINALPIHGDKSQGARVKALEGFKAGSVRVLVATDIAARGLHIEDLPIVVNLDLPFVSEDYVHRIGRTGRAGKEGKAISLVSKEEETLLLSIEKLLKQPLSKQVVPSFEPNPSLPPSPKITTRPHVKPSFKMRK